MLATPMEVATLFPVRRNRKQKQAFRDAVQAYAEREGYPVTVETGILGVKNLILGTPESARYLVTAHYDTGVQIGIPNEIAPCSPIRTAVNQLLAASAVVLPALLIALLLWALTDDPALSLHLGFLLVVCCVLLMLLGPANKENANDNSSGVVVLLEIARTMPENQRHKVCFVLFDGKETGLLGSASYYKFHKQCSDSQLVLNLDCVGDGDHIRLFPTKKLRTDRRKLTSLYKACGYFGRKDILVHEKGAGVFSSDQVKFPYGVGICALHEGKQGLHLKKMHCALEETNINILRAALTTFIACDAAQ